MSGRCVPPVNGSLTTQISPGCGSRARTAATASGIAPRWTGMCSAWAIIRPLLVEERGRAVAPLLDVGREGGADERGAHLLGDGAQRAPRTWSSNSHSLVSRMCGSIPSPHPPGGIQHVAPSSSSVCGPSTRSGSPGGRRARAPGAVRRPHGHELDRAAAVGVAVALLVRAWKRSASVGPERDRQLERLARGSADPPRPRRAARPPPRAGTRTRVTASRRSSLATSPSAESTPAAPGTSTVSDPELLRERARVQRPGAAERDEREVGAGRGRARRRRPAAREASPR